MTAAHGETFKATEAQKAFWRENSRLSLAADPDESYDMWAIVQAGVKNAHGSSLQHDTVIAESEKVSSTIDFEEHIALNALAHRCVPDTDILTSPKTELRIPA